MKRSRVEAFIADFSASKQCGNKVAVSFSLTGKTSNYVCKCQGNSCCTQHHCNTMASDVCWNNLPSVVLLEIFKRITHEERICASATCKEWRKALFFPNFWRDISINIYSKSDKYAVERCQFFTRSFMSSLRNIEIIFSYEKHYLSQLCEIISKLTGNGQMLKLQLYGFGKPRWNTNLSCCITNLKIFLEKVINVESLYIRHCWLPLLENDALKIMLEKHKDSIISLGLGAVYDKSSQTHNIKLPVDFSVFQHLTILNLDHSWVTDEVLCGIVSKKLLKRLTMQLDGEFKGHQAKMETWKFFHQALPECELRVNVTLGVNKEVMQIFSDSMPVTHIKILYCDEVDLTVMEIFYNFKNLKSVWCISEEQKSSIPPVENPFVICAWVCHKLEELVLMGFQLDNEDIIGIARLRGPKMKRLEICRADIVKVFALRNNWVSENLCSSELNEFIKDVSDALDRTWAPIDSSRFYKSNLSPSDNKINNIVEILSKDFDH